MIDLIDEIRINNNYAHHYTSEYKATIKGESSPKISKSVLLTSDYLRRMITGFEGSVPGVIPPNCRYIEKLNQGHIVVVEEPPAFRTIRISMSFRDEIRRLKAEGKLEEYGYKEDFGKNIIPQFMLAFPYVIFLLYINNNNVLQGGQAFLRIARMTGLSDYLLKIPLLNIADNQYICFGSGVNRTSHSLNTAVEKIINSFWSAEFNQDYTHNYKIYSEVAGVHSYMEWQALSKSNPMFIYNVDWLKLPMNIGQAIDEVKRQYNLTRKNHLQYQTLSNMFKQPLDTGKVEKPTKKSKIKYSLFYDIASGIYLDDTFYVHVGDPFYIKNGKILCHINSFIGFMDSGDIKYIRIKREDGRLLIFRKTKKFTKFLLDQTKKLRFEEKGILKNGVEIKENDILVMKNASGGEMYKKVSFIRKSQEGYHEGRFGDGFYILENTEGTVFDVSKPKFEGISLKKDETYAYLQSLSTMPFQGAGIVTLDGVDTGRSGQLTIKMACVDKRSGSYNLSLNSRPVYQAKTLYKLSELKPLPSLFRVGRKLMTVKRNSKLLENSVFGSPVGILYNRQRTTIDKPNITDIKQCLLSEDKFHVQSFDMDIEFNIGEKVVVSDWNNPVNMLSVKMIQGFKFDKIKGDITFILADRSGKLHQEKYVDGATGFIYVGRIRKIVNKFGKLVAGTKIKSKKGGIPHFPMKSVNIIIGFITDTGGSEPLVLCSNCCTLWYDDVVKNFQKTTMKSKKWASLKHTTIDISKIKYQPGDIVQGVRDYKNQSGWFVFKTNASNTLKILDFSYFASYADYFTLDKYITANSTLDCIPNPRISPKNQGDMGLTRAWPNLHGHFFTCGAAEFKLINDERSMVNV